VYNRAWAVFADFYRRYHNKTNFGLPVLPSCLALFISYLCARGFAPSTITSYLSAIGYVHKMKGVADPTKTFLIQKLIVAIGRRRTADIRLPLTRPLLYELIKSLSHTNCSAYQRALYSAMYIVAFYGFFRIGELASKTKKSFDNVVQYQQVTFLLQDSQVNTVKITISRFKHNTNNRPFGILIDREPTETYCPVQLLCEYLKLRKYMPGPLFCFPDGSPVSVAQFNTELHNSLIFCGMDAARYKSHSFRIGAACHAAERGLSDAQIRTLGRWNSDAFRLYIRSTSLTANS